MRLSANMRFPAAFALCLSALACQAKIGDGCNDNVDCSPDGDRICDLSQPGGYCTIPDCEPDSCPSEGVCVRFWDGPHTRAWCMKECDSNGDCRNKYYCAAGFSEVAEIIDEKVQDKGFCIETPQQPYDGGTDGDEEEEDEGEDG
jgi:hypothetical protein